MSIEGCCVLGSDGERLKEGRAPTSGGGSSACQAVMTTVLVTSYADVCQDQIMETPFLSRILPN